MAKGIMIGTGGIDLSRHTSIKYLKITGEQIFYYEDSSYETVPKPEIITLKATLYNLNLLEGNSIKWFYSKGAAGWTEIPLNRAATATSTLPISYNHTCWQGKNTTTIKASVEYKGKTYEDEFTLVKLAKGSDAYTVLLSEESQMFPTDENGGYDKAGLMRDCVVEVSVFKGIQKLKYQTQFEVSQVTQSTDTLTISIGGDYNGDCAKITPTELKADKSTAQLIVTIGDFLVSEGSSGKTRVTKSMSVTKGKAGRDGESAKVIKITGGNFFKKESDIYNPSKITLTALLQNIDIQTYRAMGGQWSYSSDRENWKPCTGYEISESDSFSLINIYPNSTGFTGNLIYYKYQINENLYDIASVGKILDGKDGVGYSIFLSNDSENIPTDTNGIVSSDYLGENGKTFTTIDVYYSSGTEITQLTPTRSSTINKNEFFLRVLNNDVNLNVATVSETQGNKIYLSSLNENSKNFDIEVRLSDGTTFSKVFSVAKSTPIKGDPGDPGAPGQPGQPGQDGDDTVIADLTNDSHLIPITPEGLESYYGCDSTLELYKGYTKINTNEVEFFFTKSDNVSGLPSIEEPGKYIVMEVMGETGWIDFTGLYKGVYYTKRFTITKVQSGADAEPAKFVTVSGEQVFKYDGDIPNKQELLVSATIHGSKNRGIWQYFKTREGMQSGWENYTKNGISQTGLDLKVGHKDFDLATKDSMTIRYVVNLGQDGSDGSTEIEISDQITIVKVVDGSDTYNAILTNESHTVMADDKGSAITGQLGVDSGATSQIMAFKGGNILIATAFENKDKMSADQFCYEIESEVGCRALRKNDSEFYIHSMSGNSATVNIRIHMTNEKKSILKKMSITKAKQGVGGLTVNISNDSHQFFADHNGYIKTATFTTTRAQALLGVEPTSITSISYQNKPLGMDISIMTPTVTITALEGSSLPDSGTLDLIITVQGTQTTKQFSWTKVKQGTPGTNGKPGEDGKSYDLVVEGGARVFNYTQLSTHPVPSSPGTYTINLYENGTKVNSKIETCSWQGYGLIKGSSSNSQTFSPTINGSYVEVNSYIEATVTFIYKGDERTTRKAIVPIAATRDAFGLDWVSEWDTGKTYIGNDRVLTGRIFAGENSVSTGVTGVALGKHMWGNARTEMGLAAYHHNVNTFALTSQGEMYIGNPQATGSAGIKFTKENVLEIVADKIQIKSEDLSGKFSTINSDINGLTHTVGDLGGKYSSLKNTADGLFHEVHGEGGKVSNLQNTANGLYHEVHDDTGKVGKLSSTVNGLNYEINDKDGKFAKLKVDVGEISTEVNGKLNASDFTSTLKQNADNILACVNDKSGGKSSGIKITSSGIDVLNNNQTTLKLTEGKMKVYNGSTGVNIGYFGTDGDSLVTQMDNTKKWIIRGAQGGLNLLTFDFNRNQAYGSGVLTVEGDIILRQKTHSADTSDPGLAGIVLGNDNNVTKYGYHNIFAKSKGSFGFVCEHSNGQVLTHSYVDMLNGRFICKGGFIQSDGGRPINTYLLNKEDSGYQKEEIVNSVYNLNTYVSVDSSQNYVLRINNDEPMTLKDSKASLVYSGGEGDANGIELSALCAALVETVKDLNNRIKTLEEKLA